MVNFTVSVTLSTPGMKRLMDEAEAEKKTPQQKCRQIIQERYDKPEEGK